MKGTIVGIAPPAPGAAPAPDPLPVPAPAPVPVPEPAGAPPMSFTPPGGGGSVNPMGSTFVADAGPVPGFPPPSPNFGGGTPFGAPAAPAPEPAPAPGATVPIPQMFAHEAAPMAAPMAAPPAPIPAPAPMGGPPMGDGYGPPIGAPVGLAVAPPNPDMSMVPAGSGAMMPSPQMPLAPPGPGPLAVGAPGTIRNPIATLVMFMVCFPLGGHQLKALEDELHNFVGDGQKASALWYIFPILPLLTVMPKLMAQARAKAGTPTQGEGNMILYFLLGGYMIPNDANQVWQQLGAR